MELNINTDATVVYTNKLEKLHKSALPSAVRGALNRAVFDVKTNTMPKAAAGTFVNRAPNFFKANSRFENASGFDINTMKASIGFVEESLKGDHNYAVKDLQQQEEGGTIKGRSFVPMRAARKGNSGLVRPNARISKIKNIVKTKNFKGTANQKFIQAVIDTGKGGYVLSGKKNILFKINSLSILKVSRNVKSHIRFKITPLYKFRKSGKPRVKPTHFMEKSCLQSAAKIEHFYIREAQRQILKLR